MRLLLSATVVLASFALPQSPSGGAQIIVDSTADNLTVDGTCTLREAVEAANFDRQVDACAAGSGADEIVLPSGAFMLDIATHSANGFGGGLHLAQPVTITGAGIERTIIQQPVLNENTPFAIFVTATPTNQQTNIVVRNLSLEDGNRPPAMRAFINYGVLLLDQVSVAGISTAGGSVVSNLSGASLSIHRSLLISNTGDLIASGAPITITESIIDGGGGDPILHFFDASVKDVRLLTVKSSTFRNLTYGNIIQIGNVSRNSALFDNVTFKSIVSSGGGMLSWNGTLTVSNSVFEAIEGRIVPSRYIRSPVTCTAIFASGNLFIVNSRFSAITADPNSSHSICVSGGNLAIERSTFVNHQMGQGPMIRVDSGATVNISDSSFSAISNNAQGIVGAQIGQMPPGAITFQAITVADSTSPLVANIPRLDEVRISGSIINAPLCSSSALTATIQSSGYNLLKSTDACATLNPATDIVTTSMALGPQLRVNDTVWVYPPLPGSPALDAGAPVSGAITLDQRSMPRSFGGARADIGAYERVDEASLKRVWLPISAR
jgi:CSLREA domain-containing protein